MLESIRLRNLRSFTEHTNNPHIELKPITVFVGKNSSGKSTCLRSLPLLRQSVEARTTGPILWYGSFVDFGAFSEAISEQVDSESIYFDFKLSANLSRSSNRYMQKHFGLDYYYGDYKGLDRLNVEIELGVSEHKNKTIATSLKLKVLEYLYEFTFFNDGKCNMVVNGEEVKGIDTLNTLKNGRFIPDVGRIRKVERTFEGQKNTQLIWQESYLEEFFTLTLMNKLKTFFHSNTNSETITEGIDRLGICERKDITTYLEQLFHRSKSFIKEFKSITEEEIDQIHALAVHKNISGLLAVINRELESTFKNIKYIAPLRATAERYYRHQDLQVEEIDHTGSNLAMLLKSWSNSENSSFQKWTMNNFGFQVRVKEEGLHYALMVQTDGDKKEYNINDMGFGFSQILPIVASIWLETRHLRVHKPRPFGFSKKQLIFAIEQPELHLHPEYQAKLATMFAKISKMAKESEVKLTILFETHSRTIIDALGDAIEEQIVSSEDVNITLFEKCPDYNSTIIKFATFDSEGHLNNWPIGFFSGR